MPYAEQGSQTDRIPDAGFRTPHSAFRTPPSGRRAFTLMELLVVITIMIFITTIVVMNIFGAMRTASYGAAANDVYDAIMLARQRACIDGSRTYLYLLDPTNYVIVRAISTVSQIDPDPDMPNGRIISDYYADLANYNANCLVVDMDRNVTSVVWELISNTTKSLTFTDAQGQMTTYNLPVMYELHITNTVPNDVNIWQCDDRYGVELHARQTLPKGFYFGKDKTSVDPIVINGIDNIVRFRPDGTLDGPDMTISVIEAIKKNEQTNRVVFAIDTNGRIHRGG